MKYALLVLALIGFSLAVENDDPIYDDPAELPDPLIDYLLIKWSVSNQTGRIIGGTEIPIDRIPWQVSFRRNNRHICGGSILSPTRGLTASHCVNPNVAPTLYSIMAGSTTRVGDANAQIRPLSRVIRHPQYNPRTTTNDIAVIWFASPLQLNQRVRPIGIPAQNAPAPYGAISLVSGWGLTREGVSSSIANNLKYTTKPVVTNQQCNIPYGGRITTDMLCAGYQQGGRDACQGDSGGPLVVNGVQIGVVSWGRGCGRPNFPGVYARVSHFNNWIRSNV